MDRITERMVEAKAERLAKVLGVPYGHYREVSPDEVPAGYPKDGYQHTRDNGNVVITLEGSLEISHAYGGVSLHAIYKDGSTGISDVFRSGHVPKRELASRIDAAISALEIDTRIQTAQGR